MTRLEKCRWLDDRGPCSNENVHVRKLLASLSQTPRLEPALINLIIGLIARRCVSINNTASMSCSCTIVLRARLKTAEREKRLKKNRRENLASRKILQTPSSSRGCRSFLFFFHFFVRLILIGELCENQKKSTNLTSDSFLNPPPISLRFVYFETKIFAQFANFLFQATLYPPFVSSLSLMLTFLLSWNVTCRKMYFNMK